MNRVPHGRRFDTAEIPTDDPHGGIAMDIKIIAQDVLETFWDLAQEPTLLRDEFLSLMRKRE